MSFWNSLAFLIIQWMLVFWSLVPLPFLNPGWTSGSSWLMYFWGIFPTQKSNQSLLHCRQILSQLSYQGSPHASEVMLKILQARLQQYVNWELPNILAGFRKGRGTSDQIANIHWMIEKAREFQKNRYFCLPIHIDVTQVWSLGQEDPLEESMTTHSSILACIIPWAEEPDGL